ncbi:MAG TPA: hypothetical protein VMV26_12710 [Alphaproteobacteria bacterium]|nr:hypothetical protein [Alphaproteobacteria bacterium]
MASGARKGKGRAKSGNTGRRAAAKPNKPTKRAGAKGRTSAPPAKYLPTRLTAKRAVLPMHDAAGPLGWIQTTLEECYGQTSSRDMAAPAVAIPAAKRRPNGTTALAKAASTVWQNVLLTYKRRKAATPRGRAALSGRPAAMVPGARNWLPLGPSVVLDGQTVGGQPVAGRVAQLAIAPGGTVIYAVSANGGVFRSEDGATTWRPLMDSFDVDPTSFASASLACGAVAIDPADPQRVYVGTGEADTLQMFRFRVINALPAYRGVGMIRSDDGGASWIGETSAPDLAGEACFALAVDPRDRENVVAATTNGLYRRVPQAGGGFHWLRLHTGVHSSVVVAASGNARRFFCARWGGGDSPALVCHSDDGGATWLAIGTGFPAAGAGRIALGVQAGKPERVYAFVAKEGTGVAHGLYRLDSGGGGWKKVSDLPDVLPVDNGTSQGDYDLAIAVDPLDADLVYLGGSYADVNPYPASIWRCAIGASGTAYKVKRATSIGTHAHSDVHALAHTPGEPDELWCTSDGGVFLNRAPRGGGQFASQNDGLACLCCNFIAQHPTDPAILFTGMQDNGTARTAGGPTWTHVMGGDGGYCVVNWADPDQILVYANGVVYRSTTGGTTHSGWKSVWNFGWATMTQPIVGLPYDPANPGAAKLVAVGAGQIIFISENFAGSWPMRIEIQGVANVGDIFALAFASPTRLFIGTTTGRVFRADRAGAAWSVARLDDAAAGRLDLNGQINDIAVDWTDKTLASVYVVFGGMGDPRRVWRFDGAKWASRSGTAPDRHLLDVEHNALAVDRAAPGNIYVGADIGVWHSPDNGLNWTPLENGLPDAPVFDLQIHPTQRLLRAATYGRGVYEITLD